MLPQEHIDEQVATLPGLDGRKMSKSYDNTIPLFEGTERDLKNAIQRVVTDSQGPGEPKDPENAHLYAIFKAFAAPQQSQEFAQELRGGLSWGAAKDRLFELVNEQIAPMRERYHELIAQPQIIEDVLLAGAEKARQITRPFMEELRQAVGLRPAALSPAVSDEKKAVAKKEPRWVSFKEGEFFFIRLLDPAGETVFLSQPFDAPNKMGQAMSALQKGQFELRSVENQVVLCVDEKEIATLTQAQGELVRHYCLA